MKPVLDLSLAQGLPCGSFSDRTEHSAGAKRRSAHDGVCKALVFHRIGEPERVPPEEELAKLPGGILPGGEGRSVEGVIDFFTNNPEGVATVTLDGTYDDKRPTIGKWTREGVPPEQAAKAFVPYTFLIEPDGSIHQMLRLDAAGAHARGFNQSGYGVAFIGDFRFEPPTEEQLDSGVAVCVALLHQLKGKVPAVKLLSHDEARAAMGQGPKECTGKHFPLDAIRKRITDESRRNS
ncbi:MAG: N-acetylmuramoyl-L-alanine amidase [Myxococcales bacterium]|nr:N-acetylmuramoyl-L-alanine amidase [Myxococcales bacterium]